MRVYAVQKTELLVQSESFDGSALRETHLSELLQRRFIHAVLVVFIQHRCDEETPPLVRISLSVKLMNGEQKLLTEQFQKENVGSDVQRTKFRRADRARRSLLPHRSYRLK